MFVPHQVIFPLFSRSYCSNHNRNKGNKNNNNNIHVTHAIGGKLINKKYFTR
jgi:hypothetical protein